MSIRRSARPDGTAGKTHVRPLGRLLVTVDDLDALLALMTPSARKAAKPRVEFVGGSFDSGSDLQKLSDNEMLSLRVLNKDVQVVLNNTAALAVGTEQSVDDIDRLWARSRQTKRSSNALQRQRSTPHFWLSVVIMISAINFSAISLLGSITGIQTPLFSNISPIANLMLGLLCAILGLALSIYLRAGPSTYAIVTPLSHAEIRNHNREELFPRRAWIVSIISVTVAAISVLVAALIRLYS